MDSGSDVGTNQVNEDCSYLDIDPTLVLACQSDGSFNCYIKGQAVPIAQGSFLYLKIETTKPMVIKELIEALDFVLTWYSGGSLRSKVISPTEFIINALMTVR